MEQLIFTPSDLALIGDHGAGVYDAISAWASINICYTKYETKEAMELSKKNNFQPGLLNNIRNIKLKRLDEYKHAFIQFLSKRLSLSRNNPQLSSQKIVCSGKTDMLVMNSVSKRIDFHIPVVSKDSIFYGKNSDFYSVGKYSQMNKCVWLGTRVTIRKIVPDELITNGSNVLITEVNVLGKIRHPCILLLLATTFDEKNNLMLLFENVDCRSLFVYLHDELRCPSEEFILSVLDQMARVLIFLHQSGWIHTNITSHAIQVMSFNRVKLSCFELAINMNSKTEINSQSSAIRQSLHSWQAPEYYCGSNFGVYTDLFQFGLLTWEMSQRKIPWAGMSFGELKDKYCLQKQEIALKNQNVLPELKQIMEQSLKIHHGERTLNLSATLNLLSSAKMSLDSSKNVTNKIHAKQTTDKICDPHLMKGMSLKEDLRHYSGKNEIQKVASPIQTKRPFSPKSLSKETTSISKTFNSQEHFRETIDSYTGLRRIKESSIRPPDALPRKKVHASFISSQTSLTCHSSSRWLDDDSNYSEFSGYQQKKNFMQSHSRNSSSVNSSVNNLSVHNCWKYSTKSSTSIKPASHSLEKGLTSSTLHEFSRISGTSAPYRAFAIKPASHQCQRGFPDSRSRSIALIPHALKQTRDRKISPSVDNCAKERYASFIRTESFARERISKAIHQTLEDNSMRESELSKMLPEENSNDDKNISSVKINKDISTKDINLDHGFRPTSEYIKCDSFNYKYKNAFNLYKSEEPERTSQRNNQMHSMIKGSNSMKRDIGAPKEFSNDELWISNQNGHVLCNGPVPKISHNENNSWERTEDDRKSKKPSKTFLTVLGLHLKDLYEDDDLGPSLWNDENMQLGMCQDFGKSLETLVNSEEFFGDQSIDIINESEEVDIDSDLDLKKKCKFNSSFYILSPIARDQRTSKLEE